MVAAESALLAAILSVMVTMAFAQVLLRQFFSTSILWGDTFLRHLVLWVGFLGAAAATADEKHFAFDTGVALIPERFKAPVHLAARLSTAAIAALLTRAAWFFLKDEKESASTLFTAGSWAVPGWWFWIILPAGFALITIHSLVKAAQAAQGLGRPQAENPETP